MLVKPMQPRRSALAFTVPSLPIRVGSSVHRKGDARCSAVRPAMITHIVLFKFVNFALAEEGRTRLLALKEKVPSLKSIDAGVDVTRSARSYDLGLFTKFDDKAGLDAYQVHPDHVEVKNWLVENATAVSCVDWES